MKRMLVTGGPVHAYLDAVKVITNRFKGGLMCETAEQLAACGVEVVYLCAPTVGAQVPKPHKLIEVIAHTGFDDYRDKVARLAPSMDGVLLGAAVANLVPAAPYKGKFPSHDYKPGDIVDIPFKIAPRVIDDVKKVAPKTQLFGYKLLAGVPHEELIRAAYGIVLEAKATAVFANDATKLDQKYAVTKERGVHPLTQADLPAWIVEMLEDEYYATMNQVNVRPPNNEEVARVHEWISRYARRFPANESGMIFGTVAIRSATGGFITTGRGKRELDSIAFVTGMDHARRQVWVAGTGKASLNAPLLARMFENPAVDVVVHCHDQVDGLPTYPYAPPGSVRDSSRPSATSFNIKEHGCMLLFDKNGRQL